VKQNSLNGWFKSGAPGVWISGGAVSIAVIMTIGLLAVIAVRGLGHFWPADLIHAHYDVPGQANHLVIGEVVQKEEVPRERLKSAGLPVPDEGPEFMTRELIKVGNRDRNGNDFTWIVGEWLTNQTTPPELMAIERREWGNFYGYLVNVKQDGKVIAEGEAAWPELQARINRVNELAGTAEVAGKNRHRRDQRRSGTHPSARSQTGTGRQARRHRASGHGIRARRTQRALSGHRSASV
jgi:phosphate transport system permease protein